MRKKLTAVNLDWVGPILFCPLRRDDMAQKTRDVIAALLTEKLRVVTKFPDVVTDTGRNIDDLIDGTAVFPGGFGLWRGSSFYGALPEYFPEAPIMFIGHNFDSQDGFKNSQERGGESQLAHSFWGVLLRYIQVAGISPNDCFFTNALMGLKPGSATGSMPSTDDFKSQCHEFLGIQIRIVKPRLIIALGGDASKRVKKLKLPGTWHKAMHPSAREFKPLVTREHRIQLQGNKIKDFIQLAKSNLI